MELQWGIHLKSKYLVHKVKYNFFYRSGRSVESDEDEEN